MTRANFNTNHDEPEVGEATIEEWLAAGGSPLAVASLVPLDYKDRPADPVTHKDGTLNPAKPALSNPWAGR